MSKESGMVQLLDAEWQRALKLMWMQLAIERGDYEWAMRCQFEFLYWHDECERLFSERSVAYWKLKCAVRGIKWK